MEPQIVTEFEKNTKERVRISLTEYGGHPLLDVRTFYQDAAGEWKPGKGIAIRRELVTTLRKALQQAERAMKDTGADDQAGPQ
jgi:hypothetical protein